MSYNKKVSLKVFWDTVEQRLAECSDEELRSILRAIAHETLPTERQAFLYKLKPMKETAAATVQEALKQEDLLTDIDDLSSELEEAMEETDYWEEEYGEEDSLGPFEEFVEPLTELFDRTEGVFDYGDLSLARAAYQKLFKVFDLEDDYGRGVRAGDLENVDMDEIRARYLRAVYETELPKSRPKVLFEQMLEVQSWLGRQRTMLDDIIQISPKPLPDQERFLLDWIAFLRKQNGGSADTWLREAIRLSQGTKGLEELARAEGRERPRAYLDWFSALEQEGKHREVLVAAQEILQLLPERLPIRAAIANHLCAAAERLNDVEALRAGRWEAFVAKPILPRLLDLWDTTPSGEERMRLMQQAAQHAKEYLAHLPRYRETMEGGWEDDLERPAWIDKSVLAHAYLLAEDFEAAHQLAAREEVLGWSSSNNPQGLVVSSFLVLLSGKSLGALSPNLTQLWQWELENSTGFGWGIEEENNVLKRLKSAYAERLSPVSLSREKEEEMLSWCLNVAKKRVNAIVSNQHRSSYGKAAVLIAACAEVLQLRGKKDEADILLNDVRNQFPRHRSFQADLKAAVQWIERSLR